MRLLATTFLAVLIASPAFAGANPADCEGQGPALIKQGCSAILAAGQNMQSLDFEAYNNRALAELDLQEPQAALQDAQAGIALNPNNGPIHLALARAYLALNQPAKALDAASQAMTLSPNDSGPYILLGELQLLRGDWQASITEQDRALQHDPTSTEAYMARAVAEMQGNDISSALADANQAASLGSTDTRIHLIRGLAAADANSWQVAQVEESLFLTQNDTGLYAVYALPVLAQAQLNLGDPHGALVSINRAIALMPQTPNFYMQRAIIEAVLGQTQPEMGDLTAVINAASSASPQAGDKEMLYHSLVLRSGTYLTLHQIAPARADITQAITLFPKQPQAYAVLADIEHAAGNLDAAVAADQKAIAVDPNDALLYASLSMLHDAQHNYAAAAADEAAILKIQPHSATDLNNRCWFLALDGKLDEALGDCQLALKITPNDPATLDSTGFVYLQKQQNELAIHYYTLALKAAPQMASSLYGRGLAEQRLGDPKKAEADIALAKKYDPDIMKDFGT